MKQIEISQPVALVRKGHLNLMEILRWFESGIENVYYVDESGRYAWEFLPRKGSKLTKSDTDQWTVALKPLAPLICDGPLNDEQIRIIGKSAQDAMKTNGLTEMPIVQQDGRVIAIAKLIDDETHEVNWPKLSCEPHIFSASNLYYVPGSLMNDFIQVTQGFKNVRELTKSILYDFLEGKETGSILCSTDIYPDNVPTVSIEEIHDKFTEQACYEHNIEALELCVGFKNFYAGCSYPYADDTASEVSNPVSKIVAFLSQIESKKPIVLKDAYNLEELKWMCTKLRESEKIGSDNHLYLYYSNKNIFTNSLKRLDWREVAQTGRIGFSLTEEYQGSANFFLDDCKPIEINEIEEIFTTTICGETRNYSGSDFFNMVLDNHPSLLTIGYHGLSSFTALWMVCLKDKSVEKAIAFMRQPPNSDVAELVKDNMHTMLRFGYENIERFYEILIRKLSGDTLPSMQDWFKAFYLAANELSGRAFKQRIVPAIFYDYHGGYDTKGYSKISISHSFRIDVESLVKLRKELYSSFMYHKTIGVVRNQISRLSSLMKSNLKGGTKSWFGRPLDAITLYSHDYWNPIENQDVNIDYIRVVRFEDLKLYPRETLLSVCEFMHLIWSDTLLEVTTNGQDPGKVDGTRGFDTAPVYRINTEYMSNLDWYRYELLIQHLQPLVGYKPKFYDGMEYSDDELRSLFAVPFKLEKISKWNDDWPNADSIKKFHEKVLEMALNAMHKRDKELFLEKNGKKMQPVPWLKPKLENGSKLYE